jgi:pyrroloquinoline-quinone synthase
MSDLDPAFLDAVRRARAAHPWQDVAYFTALADGRFDRDDFVETQIQFLFAVVRFNRPMTTLMARLPTVAARRVLLENIVAEHGGDDPRAGHESTFFALLDRLGAPPAEVAARPQWPEVRAFNTVVDGVCALDDPMTALATLGVIEDLFASISSFLGQNIIRRGWLSEADIVHYATHEVLDVTHAADLYGLVAPAWAAGGQGAYQVEQGLRLGAYAFTRLYRDLYEARTRRETRSWRGPHSAADGWSPA